MHSFWITDGWPKTWLCLPTSPFTLCPRQPSWTNIVEHVANRALGAGWFVVRNIPCQLADDKFLKEIDGGKFANPD